MIKPVLNALGQPVGFSLEDWTPAKLPGDTALTGRFCRVEPLDCRRHAAELFAANTTDLEGRMWTYMSYGPFENLPAYEAWMKTVCGLNDPKFYAFVDLKTGLAVGVGSYLRIDPANGSIEIGHLAFSPALQKTPLATEAMYLMMKNAFDLGYRRYEWKCDSLNQPSIAAAQRLGFSFEGTFRQAVVYKGRNRDTNWFSILDREWSWLQPAFTQWLAPANFDEAGRQKTRLSELTTLARPRD